MLSCPRQTQQQNQPTGSAIKSSAVTASAISLPKGGGAIGSTDEKCDTNLIVGTGSMTVPISGRSGFGPQLILTNDSGSSSPFGFGWSLLLPTITIKTDTGVPLLNFGTTMRSRYAPPTPSDLTTRSLTEICPSST